MCEGWSINIHVWGTSQSGRPLARSHYDLEVDARELWDPYHDSNLRGHVGTHDETLERMTGLAKWRTVLGRIASRISGRPRELLWSFFCTRGRHRSVALATLVSKALNELGARVNVENVEEQAGGWRRLCTDCPMCMDGTPTKVRLTAEVKQSLQDLITARSSPR